MSSREPSIVVCWTTIGDQRQADQLAKQLIQQSLAACVQIEQIVSHYRWEGNDCADAEYRLTIKTSASAADLLMKTLQEIHPYDQPQIVMVESSLVDPGYASWVRGATS